MIDKSILYNTKVLFFCVKFFGYEIHIAEKLRNFGAEVFYYDERPSNSIFTKILIRFRKTLIEYNLNKYYRNILDSDSAKDLDFVFVIKGEVIPSWFLESLREKNPKSKFIFYNWDSFKNNKNPLEVIHHFDWKFSFDYNDSKIHKLLFYPLFFINQYHNLVKKNKLYDLIFVGTIHSDRLVIINKVSKIFKSLNFSVFTYYFMPSRLLILRFLTKINGFSIKTLSDIHFKSISHVEVADLFSISDIVLDIQHKSQSGLTMRTIEAIGAGMRLITTNENIINYSFYDPLKICVINRNEPFVPEEFIESKFPQPYCNSVDNIFIDNWLLALFSGTEYLGYEE